MSDEEAEERPVTFDDDCPRCGATIDIGAEVFEGEERICPGCSVRLQVAIWGDDGALVADDDDDDE